MKILTNRNFKILTDTLSVFKNKIKELSDEAEIKDAKIESIQKEYASMQKVKDREITRLQKEISNAKKNNTKLEEKIVKLKKKSSKISASKGGYVKENNKLKAKLDAKDRVIEEYEKALYQAEEKNQNQLNTIKELTKKIDHKSIEYKNNGLPKQSKKAFKKGNK